MVIKRERELNKTREHSSAGLAFKTDEPIVKLKRCQTESQFTKLSSFESEFPISV